MRLATRTHTRFPKVNRERKVRGVRTGCLEVRRVGWEGVDTLFNLLALRESVGAEIF